MVGVSQDELKSFLHYSPQTGVFTYTKGFRKGLVAGWTNNEGYLNIKYKQKIYKLHRLAYVYLGQDLPNEIDHIDRDKTNNAWVNLRPCSKSENGYNCSIKKSNTSGFVGVSLHKLTGKWQANIREGGRRLYLGLYENVLDAARAYTDAQDKYHKGFKCKH